MKMKHLLLLVVCSIFLISCGSEIEDGHAGNFSTKDSYYRIQQKAWEYGITDFHLDENYFAKHPNISEEELESTFALFTKMNGTYVMYGKKCHSVIGGLYFDDCKMISLMTLCK